MTRLRVVAVPDSICCTNRTAFTHPAPGQRPEAALATLRGVGDQSGYPETFRASAIGSATLNGSFVRGWLAFLRSG